MTGLCGQSCPPEIHEQFSKFKRNYDREAEVKRCIILPYPTRDVSGIFLRRSAPLRNGVTVYLKSEPEEDSGVISGVGAGIRIP